MSKGNALVERLHWRVAQQVFHWDDKTEGKLSPVVLRLTDSSSDNETQVLRVESRDGDQHLTFMMPELHLESDGLHIISYSFQRRDHWIATPLVGPDGPSSPWRVEVIEDDTNSVIATIEPAYVREGLWYRDYTTGRLTPEEQTLADEWGIHTGERVKRLLIRGQEGKRWIDDFWISRLLPFGFSVKGVTKHRGKDVEATVNLGPSRIREVIAQLGG